MAGRRLFRSDALVRAAHRQSAPFTPANVGFDDGFIDVLASKGNRDRLLPLTREILDILTDCNTQSRRVIVGDRATFLVSFTGKPVTPAAVGVIFNRILDRAGLRRPSERKRPWGVDPSWIGSGVTQPKAA